MLRFAANLSMLYPGHDFLNRHAAAAGRSLLIEPINQRDMPGYFLRDQAQAHMIVDAIGRDNLKVQTGLYHCQISEGDIEMRLRQYLPTGRVGHLQIAGVPQRQEPDSGELKHGMCFPCCVSLNSTAG